MRTRSGLALAQFASRKGGSTAARSDITVTLLTSNASTTDGTSVATASVSPVADRVVYAAVISHEATQPNQPTASGNGLTWVVEKTVLYNSSVRRITVFRAQGSAPSAGAITFDFGGQTQTAFAWAVIQCAGANTSGTNGSGATLQSTSNTATSGTTITGTLAALENAKNVHLAFVGTNTNAAITHDANFAELSDNPISASALCLETEWAANRTTCSPTYATAVAGIISVEVKAA